MYFLKIFPILFKGHVDLPCGHAQKKKKKRKRLQSRKAIGKKQTNKQTIKTRETHKQPGVKKKGEWVPLSTLYLSYQIIQSYIWSFKHQQFVFVRHDGDMERLSARLTSNLNP